MPHLEEWPPGLARAYRASISAFYAAIILGGLMGLTWPRAESVPDPFLWILRSGGLLIAFPAMVSLVSQLTGRWRIELLAIWWVNIGATIYISVVLLAAGRPGRPWILFALFILATMLAVFARGITLLAFERRTRRAKGGREWGAEKI